MSFILSRLEVLEVGRGISTTKTGGGGGAGVEYEGYVRGGLERFKWCYMEVLLGGSRFS